MGALGGHQQKVRRVGVDGNEGAQVRLQVRGGADAVAGTAQLIIGQQLHKYGDILRDGFPQRDRRAHYGQLRHHGHPLPCRAVP